MNEGLNFYLMKSLQSRIDTMITDHNGKQIHSQKVIEECKEMMEKQEQNAMNKYYLVSDVFQTCKYVITKRWYHKCFGCPFMVDECISHSKNSAELIFRRRGHDFGLMK